MIYSNVELADHSVYDFADRVLDTLDNGIVKGENRGQIQLGPNRCFVDSEENPESNYILLRTKSLSRNWKFRQFYLFTNPVNQEFLRYSVSKDYEDSVEYLIEVSKGIDMAFCVLDGAHYKVVIILNDSVSELGIDEYVEQVGKGELRDFLEVIWKNDVLVPSRTCVCFEPSLLRKPNPKSMVHKYVSSYLNNPSLIKTLECPEEIRDSVFSKVLNYIYKRGYFYLYLDEECIEIIGKERIKKIFMDRYNSGEHPLYSEDIAFIDKYLK